ncbi:MFS transporter [Clostridium sp. D2Q-14]|uniref:MFS transporter n=1 Tax=Anaeromonas gelatinilytica TaxID=2683194 RepID=UPI00193BDAAC|nr:MFS transporter [Anaeromonas gelatinilytica]MBS4535521.1 MFS transporter [Anaeromonas gelatinilytica]
MIKQSFYSNMNEQDKYILKCCFFVFVVTGLYSMAIGPLLPLISNEYGLNDTISGGLISAHQAGNLIAGFIAGVLPLYLGRKKAIIFLCSFAIVGFLTIILTGNPILLILGFLFTGLSRGSSSNFNNTVVNEVSNSSPSALNFLHSIFAIGALLSPFLIIACTNVAGDIGWKIAAGIFILLLTISILLFSRMKIEEFDKETKNTKISYEFLKKWRFWISAGIFFFYLCAESAITGWIVKYFIDSNIMTTEYAQILSSILWMVILAGRLTCTFIGDRVSKKSLLLMQSIGTAIFYLLLLSTQNVVTITIAIIGLGFSMAGIYPTTVSSVGDTIKSYPMAMGVLLVIGGIGAIIMPTITGALSDTFGILAGMSAIIVAIILMIICVMLNVRTDCSHT